MNTKTLNNKTLDLIDQYLNFKVSGGPSGLIGASASCPVPYYNNKRKNIRGAIKAEVGKGSPKDIYEEMSLIMHNEKISPASLTGDSLKKLMIDHDIGIDCSGLAYHILNTERPGLDKRLSFGGIFKSFRGKVHPEKNTSVGVLAMDKNSSKIDLDDIAVGDLIIFKGDTKSPEMTRDHVAVIHQIEYQNFSPIKIHYTHSIAYPEDGEYGHGVRQGEIEIVDLKKTLTEQVWSESKLLEKARKSDVSIRRIL